VALRHFFLVILVVALWAFNNVAIKWGLHDLPPLFMTCMRFVVVAILLIPFTRVTREQLRYLLPLAFTFGFLHFRCCLSASTIPTPGPERLWFSWAPRLPCCWQC